jgi:hypothetical protein
LFLFSGGCLEDRVLPNTLVSREVASVDGIPITFREVESRRARLFNGLSVQGAHETDARLREQYLYVIRQIAEEILISRFMEDKGAGLAEGESEAEEDLIRRDYPPGAFEQMLLEEGINLDLWRGQLRRTLLVRKYIAMEIRPQVMPTPEAIQEYYNSHAAEFIIPEQWHFFHISGSDKTEVEAARKAFLANKNATDVQKRFLVTVREVRTGEDMLPEDLREEMATLAIWDSTRVKPYERGFSTLVLLERTPQTPLDAASVTARVEQILTEDTSAVVYGRMMEKLMHKAKVRIADALLRSGEEPVKSPNVPALNATRTGETPVKDGTLSSRP